MFIYPHHGCLQAFRPLSSAPKAVCHPSPAYLQPNPLHADRALPGLGAQLGPSKIFQELQHLQSWTRFLTTSPCQYAPTQDFCTPCHKPIASFQAKPNLVSLSPWSQGASMKHDIWTKQWDKGGRTRWQTGFANDARNFSFFFSYF